MRSITASSLLLSVAAAQSWGGSGSWAPGTSFSTAFPSGSSTVVIHSTQTVAVTAPISGSSWSSADVWDSSSSRISGGLGDNRPWPSSGPWPASPPFHGRNNNTFKIAILNSTNYYRYQHDAPFLVWNDSLAQNAADHADQCVWDHSHRDAGENLAEGYPDVVGSIDAWTEERDRYPFQGDRPSYADTTANFTQLVWKSTTSVGCAAVNCNGTNNVDGWYLVCEYWPPGNAASSSGDGSDNDNGTLNQQFSQNVQSQVNDGTGFNEADAVQGTDGVIGQQQASSTGPSTTAQTGENAATALNDINQDGIVTGHKGQLGLVVFFAFACAFL